MIDVSPSKQPRAAIDPGTFNDQRPAWRIGQMECRDLYSWHAMSGAKLLEVREKLGNLESMTWNQILVEARKQNHAVLVRQLSPAAQKRLKAIGQADVEELISLHLSGRERVWGIRHGAVLNVLWWDPYHEVCPSLKKHT